MKSCKVCMKHIPDNETVCSYCKMNVTILGENEPFEEWSKGELTAKVLEIQKRLDAAGL
jgi:hypothetical protein